MASESDWETASEAGSYYQAESSGHETTKCRRGAVQSRNKATQSNDEVDCDWETISESGSHVEAETKPINKVAQPTPKNLQPINKPNSIVMDTIEPIDKVSSGSNVGSNSSSNELGSNISWFTCYTSNAANDASDGFECGKKADMEEGITHWEETARMERIKSKELCSALPLTENNYGYKWADLFSDWWDGKSWPPRRPEEPSQNKNSASRAKKKVEDPTQPQVRKQEHEWAGRFMDAVYHHYGVEATEYTITDFLNEPNMPPIYKLKGRTFRAEVERAGGASMGCVQLRLWRAEASYKECQKAYVHPDDLEALSVAKAWLDEELSMLACDEDAQERRSRGGNARNKMTEELAAAGVGQEVGEDDAEEHAEEHNAK